MISKWSKSAKFRAAAILALIILVTAFSLVQASGWGGKTPPSPNPRPIQPNPPGGGEVFDPDEPQMFILRVVQDELACVEIKNFPSDTLLIATMGKMWTRGVNGIEVGEIYTGEINTSTEQSSPREQSSSCFPIPEELMGEKRISIRLQSEDERPYYAFNWFYNTDSEVAEPEVTPTVTPTLVPTPTTTPTPAPVG